MIGLSWEICTLNKRVGHRAFFKRSFKYKNACFTQNYLAVQCGKDGGRIEENYPLPFKSVFLIVNKASEDLIVCQIVRLG